MNPNQTAPRHRRAGFTLIELLVVIGIIAVLMSILIPVVANVKKQSHNAATQAQITNLMQGIEQYRQVFEAYPGPLADTQIRPKGTIGIPIAPAAGGGNLGVPTGSENLVFGLLGGLLNNAGAIQYDPRLVGKGPQSLNPLKVQTYGTFVDPAGAGLDPVKNGTAWVQWSQGQHSNIPFQGKFSDTTAPEFVDRFPDAMPILYIRAQLGATAVVTNNTKTFPSTGTPATAAYDMRQLFPYTFPNLPFPPSNINQSPTWPSPPAGTNNVTGHKWELYSAQYFGTPDPKYDTPRQKEAYLLISAGIDRAYGTKDDVTNSGSH